MKALTDTSVNNEARPLAYSHMSGFTVFNPYGDTVLLRIPPVPQALSKVGLSKAGSRNVKKTADGQWAVRVAAMRSDSTEISPVYCGFSKGTAAGTSFYPAAPSLAKSGVYVFNQDKRTAAGHAVMHAAKNGGYAFLLSFTNGENTAENISYHLENLYGIPAGMYAAVYDENSKRFEDMSRGDMKIALAPNSTDFRWLLVGTKDYLAKASLFIRPAMLSLIGTYPNPFRTFVRIRYNLPYEGVDKLRFFIFDLRGRVVWRRDVTCGANFGPTDMVWNARTDNGGLISAGIYIVKMVAINAKQKAVAAFERKMTFIP
jgi:hypothetical protein